MYIPKKIARLLPGLIYPCVCGATYEHSIEDHSLYCPHCGLVLSENEMLRIAVASRTIYNHLSENGIENVIFENALYEIDEAAGPNGLLPIFVQNAALLAEHCSKDHTFPLSVQQVTPSDSSLIPFVVVPTLNSQMPFVQATSYLVFATSQMIERSFQDKPNSGTLELNALNYQDLIDRATKHQVA